jgi:hypothetical protein
MAWLRWMLAFLVVAAVTTEVCSQSMSVDTTTITGIQAGSYKWQGMALADNVGKLFAAPGISAAVLMIDPITNTFDETTLTHGQTYAHNGLWIDIAYAANVGKLFCAPRDAGEVLIIDPVTNTTDATAISGLGAVRNSAKWNGITYVDAVNNVSVGKLFLPPWHSGNVLIVDPLANTSATIAVGSASDSWSGFALADNVGKLYSAPNAATVVLVVDPLTNATDTTTLGGLGSSGGNKWAGIAYASNVGKLFCAPFYEGAVLIVDPSTNTTDMTTLAGLGTGGTKWTGTIFVGSVGKIFAAPYSASSVLVVDPIANSTDTTTLAGLGTSASKWSDFAFADSVGKLFASPNFATIVLVVDYSELLVSPTAAPSSAPTVAPTAAPTAAPSAAPTRAPTAAPTSVPTAAPTAAPTSCAVALEIHEWTVSADGVVNIPSQLGGCGVYSYTDVPVTVRLPNSTTTLRFPGPGLVDPDTPSRFALWTTNLPSTITLDLGGNSFTVLPAAAFFEFGHRLGALDLSGGRITTVHPNTLAGLIALQTLTLADNVALESLPDGWLSGLSVLATLDLSGCALANVSNATLLGASNLTALNLDDNPILSMDSDPFPPSLPTDGVSMVNTSLICIPASGVTGTTPDCVACSPAHNLRTLLVQSGGRSFCDFPAEVSALVNATQYTPPYSGSDDRDYLAFGARSKWALGRTYHVQPVNFTEVALLDGRTVWGSVAFSVTDPPSGLFVDIATGELLFVPRELQVARVSYVTARHTYFPGVATVGNLTFEVLLEDVLNPDARGPNGRDCANNGTKTDGPYVAPSPFVNSDVIVHIALCCAHPLFFCANSSHATNKSDARRSSRVSRSPLFYFTLALARDVHIHFRAYKRPQVRWRCRV